jgi:hypothetical protein
MKDSSRTKFCLGLQLEHLQTSILVHHSTYVYKVLENFNIDKAYLARTPTIVRALENDIDPFRSKGEGEEVLRSEYRYLSVIGVLIYLVNNTRPDIAFIMNCLTT